MNRSKRGVKNIASSAGYDLPKHFGDFRQMIHTFMLNVGVLESADRLCNSLTWASISYEFTNYVLFSLALDTNEVFSARRVQTVDAR